MTTTPRSRRLSFRDHRAAPVPLACQPMPADGLVTSQRRTLVPHPIGPIQRVQVVAPAASVPCSGTAALPRRRRMRSGLGRAGAAGRSRPGAQRRNRSVTSASVGTGRHGTIVAVERVRCSGTPCRVDVQQHSACRAEVPKREYPAYSTGSSLASMGQARVSAKTDQGALTPA